MTQSEQKQIYEVGFVSFQGNHFENTKSLLLLYNFLLIWNLFKFCLMVIAYGSLIPKEIKRLKLWS